MKPTKKYVQETLPKLLNKYGFGYKEIYLELDDYLIIETVVFRTKDIMFEAIISAYAYALKELRISVFEVKKHTTETYITKHIKIEQF